jgi:ferredoxin, 2Fe-2S
MGAVNVQVTFLPENKTVTVRKGTTLLAASRLAKVAIRTRCGGYAGCLMCKVVAEDSSGLSPAEEKERNKLGSSMAEGYRLACQAKAVGSAIVRVPEDPLKAAIRAQLARQQEEDLW